MKFDDICWHDGNIKRFSYDFPIRKTDKTKIEIIVDVQKDFDSNQYHLLKITFENVRDISKNIDFIELADNVGAGSISNADETDIKVNSAQIKKYKIYLLGGFVSIVSDLAKIEVIQS